MTHGEVVRREPIQNSLNGVRVLVVDDDPANRDLVGVMLSYAGAEVRVSPEVRAALEMLDQWIPDVLISDIGMPNEDGYTLIKEVRSRSEELGGLTPALALTGYASERDAINAREAGFQMHLSKPVASAKLIAAVGSLAQNARGTA
jgi:CheY-like chemotaxis protein